MTGTLLRLELDRARRDRFLWLACALQILMAWIARQGARSLAGPAGLDGPTYMVFAMNLAGTLTTPLLSAIFAAALVAGDHGRGTIRVLLTWPVSRTQLLASKILCGVLVALVLHATLLLSATFVALQMPLETAPDPIEPTRTPALVLQQISLAWLSQALPLLATVTFAVAISVLCSQAATAIGITIGVLLALEPLKLLLPEGYDHFVFSTHFDTPTAIAQSRMDQISATWLGEEMLALVLSSLAAMFLFVLVARWQLQRQAITP